MKNVHLRPLAVTPLLFFFFILAACKKNRPSAEESGLQQIRFNIKEFSQSKTPLNGQKKGGLTTMAATPDSVATITYQVYNSTGTFVKRIVHKPFEPGYENFIDNLAPGTYTIVFVAGFPSRQNPGNLSFVVNNTAFYYYIPNEDIRGSNGSWRFHDVFYKKFTITVGNTPIDQDVVLQRIIAKVELNIEDAIPVNISKISLQFIDIYSRYTITTDQFVRYKYPDSDDYYMHQNYTDLTNWTPGSTNNKITTLTANINEAFPVNIICYDYNDNVVFTKEGINVTCDPNKRTIITGKLFPENSATTELKVSRNSAWSSDSTLIEF